eukprot:4146683-Lingulodinium_polyedra.AAC.1
MPTKGKRPLANDVNPARTSTAGLVLSRHEGSTVNLVATDRCYAGMERCMLPTAIITTTNYWLARRR